MSDFFKLLLGSSILTTFLTSLIAFYFHKKTEIQNASIKREFEQLAQRENSDFEWRKKTTELLGQVYIHLNRTRLAFDNHYSKLKYYDKFFEDEVMYKSNKHIRDLIIDNGHYLPPDLLDEASKLVEHFDLWLTKYNLIRVIKNNTEMTHIYVGPDGFRFPINAEQKFKDKYIELFKSLRSLTSL